MLDFLRPNPHTAEAAVTICHFPRMHRREFLKTTPLMLPCTFESEAQPLPLGGDAIVRTKETTKREEKPEANGRQFGWNLWLGWTAMPAKGEIVYKCSIWEINVLRGGLALFVADSECALIVNWKETVTLRHPGISYSTAIQTSSVPTHLKVEVDSIFKGFDKLDSVNTRDSGGLDGTVFHIEIFREDRKTEWQVRDLGLPKETGGLVSKVRLLFEKLNVF